MPKKYHIPVKMATPRFPPIGKFTTIEFREDCAGSCRECVKKKCVYGVFKENHEHALKMIEPEYLFTCQSCFRCVQECTKAIFSRVINPHYKSLGDDYWRRDILFRLWYQAHTGKIPVSGAGYRGPFTGKGFDGMWTDMSEIVRPTRDGIHGREYINTGIELSRRGAYLKFTTDGTMIDVPAAPMEIPIPILFQWPRDRLKNVSLILSAVKAAATLGTLMFIHPDDLSESLLPYAESLAFCIDGKDFHDVIAFIKRIRMVEVPFSPHVKETIQRLREIRPDVTISVGMPLTPEAADAAARLTEDGVDVLHFYADDYGREHDALSPRFLKDCIRTIHQDLVRRALRPKVNLLFSGGISMAEHMAKAIICGADGIVADTVLLVALECRLCNRCREGLPCPVELDKGVQTEWGKQRIVNLMGAWHSQLLEVMGAMGIRDARRLRGEIGRSMHFVDLEKEAFAPIFGTRVAAEN